MTRDTAAPKGAAPLDRGTLFRDALLLQVKLTIDGVRDLVLVPLSLAAAAISFLRPGARPGTEFYDLLRLGRRSERWIDLFGAADRVDGSARGDAGDSAVDNLDRVADRIETYLRREYRTGRISQRARARFDKALEDLRREVGDGPDAPG